MIRSRVARRAPLLLVTVLLSACATVAASTGEFARTDDPDLTARYGTKQLVASGPVAFAAVAAGLRAQGFEVAIANRDRGFIRTEPKQVALSARSDAFGGAYLVERTFQVVAELTRADGRVKVALKIYHYRNGVDVTARELVRPAVLVEIWRQVFDAVYDALPAREPAPTSEVL
ncbi:MAG: hypothetical protein EP329_07165 [Deltaproteobacteria bacterium]|nr:MAG: hypothetical protein EP329_07165 [Deltaproteobacteria bacterium]